MRSTFSFVGYVKVTNLRDHTTAVSARGELTILRVHMELTCQCGQLHISVTWCMHIYIFSL